MCEIFAEPNQEDVLSIHSLELAVYFPKTSQGDVCEPCP